MRQTVSVLFDPPSPVVIMLGRGHHRLDRRTPRGGRSSGRVVHFELFAENAAQAAEFYRDVFGWDIQTWGGPFEYWLVDTGPQEEPGIGGAIAPPGVAGDQSVVVTVEVSDLDGTLERLVAAGGRALTAKAPIAGVGWQAYAADPSGLVVGLLQPDEAAGPAM